MKALRIQNIYFTSSDVKKAKAFYQDLLSLDIKFQDEEKWIQYDCHGQNLALASHEEAGTHKNAIVVIEIDNAEHLQGRVAALGGMLTETRDMGGHGVVYTVLDPEGNMFQLFTKAKSDPK